MARKPAKTPIIAGSVCGGVLLLAWTVGFSIYFRKRYKRKQLERAAAAIGMPPPEIKSRPPVEEVVIPPDPAVLLGHHKAGYAFAEGNHTHTHTPAPNPIATHSVKVVKGVDTGQSTGGGIGIGGSGHGASAERLEERRPLLTVMADVPDISELQRPRNLDEEIGHGVDVPKNR